MTFPYPRPLAAAVALLMMAAPMAVQPATAQNLDEVCQPAPPVGSGFASDRFPSCLLPGGFGLDGDGDGVIGPMDRCNDTPAGEEVDPWGCAEGEEVQQSTLDKNLCDNAGTEGGLFPECVIDICGEVGQDGETFPGCVMNSLGEICGNLELPGSFPNCITDSLDLCGLLEPEGMFPECLTGGLPGDANEICDVLEASEGVFPGCVSEPLIDAVLSMLDGLCEDGSTDPFPECMVMESPSLNDLCILEPEVPFPECITGGGVGTCPGDSCTTLPDNLGVALGGRLIPISVAVDPAHVLDSDESATIEVTVSNTGTSPGPATLADIDQVVFTIEGYTIDSISGGDWNCEVESRTCSEGSLPAGQNAIFMLEITWTAQGLTSADEFDVLVEASGDVQDTIGRLKSEESATIMAWPDLEVLSAKYVDGADGDADGVVDGILLEFNRDLGTPTDCFDVTLSSTAVTVVGVGLDDETITLKLDAIDFEGLGTSLLEPPRVVYPVAGCSPLATDENGLLAKDFGEDATDGAGPVLIEASTSEAPDKLKAVFSENVKVEKVVKEAFTFVPAQTGQSITAAVPADGSKTTFWLTVDPPFLAGDGGRLAPKQAIEDEAGNPAPEVYVYVDISPVLSVSSITTADRVNDVGDEGPDGRIDTVVVEFTEALKADTTVDVNDWTISTESDEYTITDAAMVQDDIIEFSLNQMSDPDTGVTTLKISYQVLDDQDRLSNAAEDILLGNIDGREIADGAPPVLLHAETVDGAGDGILDGVRVQFSEAFTGEPGDWAVASDADICTVGDPILTPDEDKAGDGVLLISISCTSGSVNLPTDAEPTVTYEAGSLKDAAENLVADGSVVAVDAAAPVLLSVTGNPGESFVTLTFSELVLGSGADGALVPGDLTYGNANDEGAAAIDDLETISDKKVKLFLDQVLMSEDLDPDDTPDTIQVKSTVKDTKGLTALGDPVAFTDVEAPQVVSATTKDTTGDGRIDEIVIEFSEDLDGFDDGDFEVDDRYTITDSSGASGATVTLMLAPSEEDGVIDTADRPDVTYTGTSLTDLLGNEVAIFTVDPADGAAPVPISATTIDDESLDGTTGIGTDDGNGKLNAYLVKFSEPVTALDGSGGWTVAGRDGAVVRAISHESVADDELLIVFQEGDEHDTDALPAITYDGTGAVADLFENAAAEFELADDFLIDGAAPVLYRVEAQEGDDTVTVFFSEPVHNGDGQSLKLSAFEYVDEANGGAAGIVAVAHDVEETFAILTLDAALTLEDMQHDGIKAKPASVVAGQHKAPSVKVDFTDEVPPTVVGVTTEDRNEDGRIDRINIKFSETLDPASTLDADDFHVDGYTINSDSTSFAGKTLTLALDIGADYDTDMQPDVTFDPISATALKDSTGNFWDGALGHDAEGDPLSSVVAQDGAPPVIVEALVTPGSPFIDVRFSEPVFADSDGLALDDAFAFEYVDQAGAQALLDSIESRPGNVFRLQADPDLTGDDIAADKVQVAATELIFDAAGLSAPTAAKSLTEYDGPAIKAVTTSDSDGDGILDAIVVTFNRVVESEGALDQSAWTVAEPFMIDSISISGTDSVEIRLQTSDPDTAAVPAVTYTRPSGGAIVGDDGAPTASILGLDGTHDDCQVVDVPEICTLDGAAPALVKASGNTGSDEVTLHFSEPINRDLAMLDLLYDDQANGDAGIDDLLKASTSDGKAKIQLFEALTPEHFGLHEVGVKAGLPDAAGNQGLQRLVPILDDVPPYIVAVTTMDRDSDGWIDALRVTFSETLDFDSLSPDRFLVDDSNDGVAIQATLSDTEFILEFTPSEVAGGDTDATPKLTYDDSPESTDDPVTDLEGNVLQGYSAAAKDGAAPVAMTAKTVGDGTGSLEGYVVTFSEPLAAGATKAGWSVGGKPAWDVTASNPNELLVIFDGLALEVGTGDTPELTYSGSTAKDQASPVNRLGVITDASGDSDLIEEDGAAPVITHVDAQVGRKELVVFFSEPVHNGVGGKLSVNRFTYDGGTIKSVSHIALDTRAVLTLGAAVADSDMNTKSVGLVPDKVFDVANLAGDSTPVTIADLTDPFVLSAVTADEDGNGRIDRVVLTFNEAIIGTPVKEDFVLPGYPVNNLQVSGLTIILELDEGASPDTGVLPMIVYGGSDVEDMHHNEWDGYVPETRDGAAPVAVRADVIDAAATVVRATFSEGVGSSGGDGASPSHFVYEGGANDDKAIIDVSKVNLRTFDLTLDTPLSASDQTPGHANQDRMGFSGLTDPAGNEVAGGAIGVIGGPVVQSITTMDTSGEGVDMLKVVFNRPIDDDGGANLVLGDWSSTIEAIKSIRTGLLQSPQQDEKNDDTIYLILVQSIDDTSATPAVSYDGTSIVDATSAALVGFAGHKSLDGVPPRILSIETWDDPGTSSPPVGDGILDSIHFIASEPLDMSTFDSQDWIIEGASVIVAGPSSSQPTPVFRFLLSNEVDSGVTPVVSYDGTLTDVAGNLLLPLVDFVSKDNAPPILLSATSAGFDSTQVTLVFSEPVTGSGEGGALVADDLAYTNAGGGASGIIAVSHSGALTTLTLDAGFVDVDNLADTVAAISGKITDAAGLAAPSIPVLLSTETSPPARIADLAVGAVTANSIALTFTAVADDGTDPESGPAVAYLVRYAAAPITTEAKWNAATQASISKSPGAPGSAETLTITGLEPQTAYHVAVRAMDKAGNKGDLSIIAATTILDITPPPGTFAVTSQTHTPGQASPKTTATLNWNQMPDPQSVVTYHYKVNDQATYTVKKTDPQTTGTSLTQSSLEDGTHYVHVAAFSAGGSKQAEPFKLVIDTVAPARIDDFAASDAGPLSITLTWTAPGDNGDSGTAADYQVYRSDKTFTANDLADINLATGVAAPAVAGTKQSFEVTGLTPDTAYHFAIRARDAAGNKGQLSSILTKTTAPDSTPPTGDLDLRSTTHIDGVPSNRREVAFRWDAATDLESEVMYRYALVKDEQYALSDDDDTTKETSVNFDGVDPGHWTFMVAAESTGGRGATQTIEVILLGLSDADIAEANKQIVTKVTRKGPYNVIDWTLPAIAPADVHGVQVLRSNSPFQVIATISTTDAAYASGRFVDETGDAKSTSRYLVTMYYGNSASLGKQPEGQDVQISESLNDISVAPSADSRGMYARPALYVGLFGMLAIVGLAITGVLRFNQGRRGGGA